MKPSGLIRSIVGWLIVATLLAACERISIPPREVYPAVEVGSALSANLDSACVSDYRPDVDYFPKKIAFTHSDQLSVSYGLNYKRVQFRAPVDNGPVLEILLVQCGTPVPEHKPDTLVVQVPVARIATDAIRLLGAFADLGIEDRLIGVPLRSWVSVPSILERIDQGLLFEVEGGTHLSIEPILAAQPDVWLSFYNWANPDYQISPKARELGVHPLPVADENESHPLGGAEWLKFLALTVNREARADAVFEGIVERYEAIKQRAQQATTRPLVMFGNISGREVFETFVGRSALEQLFKDAGGEYALSRVGSDSSSGAVTSYSVGSWQTLPLEQVYALGARASVWVGGPQGVNSVAGLIAEDPRYALFDAVRSAQVYTYDLGYVGNWAYPYWDDALTRPDVLLEETLYALHPELFPVPPEPKFLRDLASAALPASLHGPHGSESHGVDSRRGTIIHQH